MPSEDLLGKILPLLSEVSKEVLNVLCREVVFTNSTVEMIPNVFYRVQIRATCRPVYPLNALALEKVIHNSSTVNWCVVVLQQGLGANTSQQGNNKRAQDLVPVPDLGRVTLNMIERGSKLC